ncbi:hypothetical protein L5515_002268 [Caenorhabditis briggsae]|uniref:Farnesyl pyrophosphate synthase n=1 Tax=Caenorhabditis briggsae TaxID=6238 RepID=A0AAE9J0R9_CAEBR|nr:hypothetical protein L3Y34_016194 [Caenorhabditis briggsae]UMM14482.1 hypothetical protein L5515_002268 [Caenorhabditis briggsae]
MFASRKLVETALGEVKKKFVRVVSAKLPADGMEYDLVQYRCKNLFDNTVIGGKYSRASLCVDTIRALQPHLREETQELQAVCEAAATLEIIQSFYLIADDIMDNSETRRGKPCWFRREGVGMSAINDAFIMDSFVEDILRLALPGHINLDRLCEAYRKSKQKTLIGQFLDTSSVNQIASFTWDRYELMVENKTSHYTVFHPLQMALIISDVLAYHGSVKKAAYQIGFLFQSQDDFLDDGKCTWLAVRALQKMHSSPKISTQLIADFKQSFGSSDPEKVEKIRKIYDELQLREEFRRFEQHFAGEIKKSIAEIPDVIEPIRPVLDGFVTKMVKRNA